MPEEMNDRESIMGANNVRLPLVNRVRTRLSELRRIGKVEFVKDEHGQHQTIEPEMPIKGSLEFGACVKKLSDDEYTITYDVYDTETKKGKKVVKTVLIKAGPADIGMTHKIASNRITETFKTGKPYTSKTEKLEEAAILLEEANKTQEYQKLRKEKIES